jgi:hypothetical protein
MSLHVKTLIILFCCPIVHQTPLKDQSNEAKKSRFKNHTLGNFPLRASAVSSGRNLAKGLLRLAGAERP